MIRPPSGWTSSRVGADGLLMTPPAGPATGAIQYRERLAPLATRELRLAAAGLPDGFVVDTCGDVERGHTAEGEWSEVVRMTGTLRGVPTELTFAFVLLDDYYARLTGIAYGTANAALIAAQVRRLAHGDAHMLGQIRRRRFRYAVPAAWSETTTRFAAELRALASPETRIYVVAALPFAPDLEDTTVAAFASAPRTGPFGPPTATVTARGLRGRVHHLPHPVGETLIAFLDDGRFAYIARAEGPRGGIARASLLAFLDSIEPIPLFGTSAAARAAAPAVMGHWVV